MKRKKEKKSMGTRWSGLGVAEISLLSAHAYFTFPSLFKWGGGNWRKENLKGKRERKWERWEEERKKNVTNKLDLESGSSRTSGPAIHWERKPSRCDGGKMLITTGSQLGTGGRNQNETEITMTLTSARLSARRIELKVRNAGKV